MAKSRTIQSDRPEINGAPAENPQVDASPWLKFRAATHRRREDSQALSPEARSLYFDISCDQVTEGVGPPPADQRVLRAMYGREYIDWQKAWRQVKPYTRSEGGRLYTRLGDEWTDQLERDRAKASEAGKASARARAQAAQQGGKEPSPKAVQRPLNGGQRPLDFVQPRASSGSGESLSTDPLPAADASGESAQAQPRGKGRASRAPASEPSGHKRDVDSWCEMHRAEVGRPYPFRAGRDGDHVKAIRAFPDYTPDEFDRRAALHMRDPFWRKQGFDLGTFLAQWAKLGNAGIPPRSGQPAPPRQPTQDEYDRWNRKLDAELAQPDDDFAKGESDLARQEIERAGLSVDHVRLRAALRGVA